MGDSTIYVLDSAKLEEADESIDPFELKKDVLYLPPHSSARFVAQKGIFTVHHQPEKKFELDTLAEVDTQIRFAGRNLGTLGVYGVTAGAIFPDLTGVCKDLCRHWTNPVKGLNL